MNYFANGHRCILRVLPYNMFVCLLSCKSRGNVKTLSAGCHSLTSTTQQPVLPACICVFPSQCCMQLCFQVSLVHCIFLRCPRKNQLLRSGTGIWISTVMQQATIGRLWKAVQAVMRYACSGHLLILHQLQHDSLKCVAWSCWLIIQCWTIDLHTVELDALADTIVRGKWKSRWLVFLLRWVYHGHIDWLLADIVGRGKYEPHIRGKWDRRGNEQWRDGLINGILPRTLSVLVWRLDCCVRAAIGFEAWWLQCYNAFNVTHAFQNVYLLMVAPPAIG